MKAEQFYAIMEKMETATLPSGTGQYYPSIEDIDVSIQDSSVEELLPVILYYASNPFPDITDTVYTDTVKHCKDLSYAIPLE